MALRLAPSSVTLGGLLKHLAWVEELYFQHRLAGRPIMAPFDRLDLQTDWEDWPWRTATDDTPSALRSLWVDAVHRSRASLTKALSNGELDQPTYDGMSLRRLLADLIEEYARHTGHADLLSEAVDGRFGEDPPEGWTPVGAIDDGEGYEAAVPHFERRRMLGVQFHAVDLTGAEFTYVDLDGARAGAPVPTSACSA